MFRRPVTQKERVIWFVLFVMVMIGLRYFAPHFRPVTPSEAPIKSGFQIVDDIKTGLPQPVLHAESVLSFEPSESKVRPGQTFTLQAVVDTTMNKISGAELSVSFDQALLKLERITASPVFSLDLQPPAIDNRQGMGSIALGIPLEKPTVSGRQSIAVFTFRALVAVGNTEVTFAEKTLLAADNEPGNVIRERQAARVSIAVW